MLDVELLAFEEKLSVLLLCCCLWLRDELPVDCVVELKVDIHIRVSYKKLTIAGVFSRKFLLD